MEVPLVADVAVKSVTSTRLLHMENIPDRDVIALRSSATRRRLDCVMVVFPVLPKTKLLQLGTSIRRSSQMEG